MPLTPDTYVRAQGIDHFHFDVAADGRFLFVTDPNAAAGVASAERYYGVVLNWTEELKRPAPVSR